MCKKIIGLFCGSFNPPLYSHLSLAEQLLNIDNNIEKIIFVPVSHQYSKEGLIPDKHRYNMLKLICTKNRHFDVSDIEINSSRQPYTLETMKNLQQKFPQYELRLIIGTDNLKNLENWYEIESLLKKFKIIVLVRDEDNIEEIITNSKLLSKYRSSLVETKTSLRTNLSSTFVRNLIKQNKSVRYLLPDEVIEYIQNNNLYI